MISNSVLQVEDDENDVFFLKTAFQRAGIRNPLHVVNDGQSAIDYLDGAGEFADRSQHPLPGLVLLDLKLPNKSGLEVLAWMRRQPLCRCVPVVILTASAQETDVLAAYQGGANAYLLKPTGADELVDLAGSIKSFWLTRNVLPTACEEMQREPELSPDSGSR